MKKVTVQDVVLATGYSRRGVYAALRDDPTMSSKSRLLIQKKAREVGFSVDPVLSALGRSRWKSSGGCFHANIVFFLRESDRLCQSFINLSKKVCSDAEERGFGLSFVKVSDFKSIKQADREFRAQGVRGIGALSLLESASAKFVAGLNFEHIAVVGNEKNREFFHSITMNWAEMLSTLIEQMVQRGYKKLSVILMVNKPMHFYDEQRIGAILLAEKKFNISIKIHMIEEKLTSSSRKNIGVDCALMRERASEIVVSDRPDAVIAWSDMWYWIFKDLGYRLPEDMGYMSMLSAGESTGMSFSAGELLSRELDRLIELINNQDFGLPVSPITSMYTPRFVDWGTA